MAGTNTTLAVVATDAPLTKTQCHRLAQVAHDAFAQAIRPVHTAFDGDTVFAVSTGVGEPLDDAAFLVVQVAAVETLAQAIRAAVYDAPDARGVGTPRSPQRSDVHPGEGCGRLPRLPTRGTPRP